MTASALSDVDAQLRAIISNLYMLLVQAHDYQGSGTQQAMQGEIKRLMTNLLSLSKTSAHLPTRIPLELIQFVEDGRNPDIYTRELVEGMMKYNQMQRGQSEALAQFRDVLAEQIAVGIPEMKEDVRRTVEATGGELKV